MVSVPSIVGMVVKVETPAVSVRLLKVMAFEPFTVAAFTMVTVPVPLIKVPLLVKVPPALMFKFAAAFQLNVPLFTTLPAIIEPPAPLKVNTPVPLVVMALVTVPTETVALTVAVIPVFTVIELTGVFVNAAAMFKAWAMVALELATGKAPPNQEAAVFQLLAPLVVIYPKLV